MVAVHSLEAAILIFVSDHDIKFFKNIYASIHRHNFHPEVSFSMGNRQCRAI